MLHTSGLFFHMLAERDRVTTLTQHGAGALFEATDAGSTPSYSEIHSMSS